MYKVLIQGFQMLHSEVVFDVQLLNAVIKKALVYLYKLEKQTIEMVKVTKEIIHLAQEFEKKYLNKE